MRPEPSNRRTGTRPLTCGLLVAALVVACAVSLAHGQKATDQYIPIGQSPGLSKKYSSLGQIADVNPRDSTVTIAEPDGPHAVRITARTRIWLDRTKLKQSNVTGRFADLQKGRRAEIKYVDPKRRDLAEWVKVEIAR